ncbi:UDP-2,4-diacetamido-2,4,6-trideoxy-beta-L-altropyranose hydrolase [Candidatus Peregrinibacteria bacterium]|nr:UDP-2,4-diacetamido-2,4,6-trideoxy-beta-L-altropyranose hydrolase [Candidatus Peregrinibacteria bacterium]
MHAIFRADASVSAGTGHVMRCLALAQRMNLDIRRNSGHDSVFVCAAITPSLKNRLRVENIEVANLSAAPYGSDDACETARLAKSFGAEWVVVDGYGFGSDYQDFLKQNGLRVIFLDDYGHAGSYSADIILNQNVSAREEWYRKRDASTRLLLGPDYVLLRREFLEWREKRIARAGAVRHILVTLGGADHANITAKALRAIARTGFSGTISVIIGGSNPHRSALEAQADSMDGNVRVVVDALDMPARMAEADMAISAAGTTSWELLFMGVPFLTGSSAGNQTAVSEALEQLGLAKNIGWYNDATENELAGCITGLIADTELRSALSRKGLATVDGNGAARVLQAMLVMPAEIPAPAAICALTVRDATMNDARMLFDWANDPFIRSSSFSPEPIPWKNHLEWMKRKLADGRCRIYVGIAGNRAIGQIRFDVRDDGDAEIDVHLSPAERGKGYGTRLIMEGVKRFFGKTSSGGTVHALVKTGNAASRNAFVKAGFEDLGKEAAHGTEVYHFVFRHP